MEEEKLTLSISVERSTLLCAFRIYIYEILALFLPQNGRSLSLSLSED